MLKRTPISRAALLCIGAALAGSALAEEASTTLERVEVTGTRIKTIGNTSSSPITSVGKEQIASTQPVAVEELVRGLPSSYPAIGPTLNNGSNGTASIDLRGLGSNRTLVLFNGKRFVPATLGGVVDTNSVPVSLLERVDLVTGGASAVYGADAVSGVVNFVTKRNFRGVEATTLYSSSDRGDAARYKADLTVGGDLEGGRGNIAVHVGTTRTDPLLVGSRPYASTQISSTTGLPGGFSTTAVPATWSGMPAPLAGNQVIDASSGLLRASSGANPPDGYNTNPPNLFETPLQRTQMTGLGHFKVNDSAEIYSELFHTRSTVTTNLAPSGTFGASLNMPIGNPLIPQAVRQQLCTAYKISAANCVVGNATTFKANIGRRFVEAGPRIYSFDNVTTQYTAGLRGELPFVNSWSYDAYYQSGRSDQTQTTQNGFSYSRLQKAVNSLDGKTCVDPSGGCVPINLFGAAGSITPAMLNYLAIPTFKTTTVRQTVKAVSASGEVGAATSPWASTPLGLALGFESRDVFGGNASDAVIQTQGELLGSGAPTPDRSGTLSFSESYMEANLPLVQDRSWAKELNLGAGYRHTSFSTSAGGQNQGYGSWKTGLDWTPVKGLRLRGEQQRATRAPNVNELFAPVTTGLSSLAVDPCQGNKINAGDAGKAGTLTNLCQQTGVPTSQIGYVSSPSSGQINNTAGGNPNLGPEIADTTTLGLVWEPSFASGLSMSVDYWRIKINKAVSSPTATQVMAGCYDPALNPGYTNNVFCQSIQRDALAGNLNGNGSKGVVTLSSNLGSNDFAGVDLGANYRLPLQAKGRVDFGLQLSYLDRADFKALPTIPTLIQAGYYGLDVGTPYSRVRFTQRTQWTQGDFSAGYVWRFIGGSEVQMSGQGAFVPAYSKIGNFSYFDLNGSWQATKNVKLQLTVNNAFDLAPPLIGTGIGPNGNNIGNTFPGVYDVVGRRFTLTATASF